jgi:hypothetical protein
LENPEHPGDVHHITLLRPQTWLEAEGLTIGTRVWMNLEELSTRGWAVIEDIGPYPPVAEGPGQVVMMTVSHENSYLFHLTLAAQTKAIQVTGYHKLWSITHGGWTSTENLQRGDCLLTLHGPCLVEQLSPVAGGHRVYNFEVENEHCYFAGDGLVLGHNLDCAPTDVSAAAKTPAQRLADKAQELSAADRPNIVAVIKHPNGTITVGRNQGSVTHPDVDAAVASVPPNQFGAQCAELNALARARGKGRDLKGAEISISHVRGPNSTSGIHGTPRPPCSVCEPVVDSFGVTVKK